MSRIIWVCCAIALAGLLIYRIIASIQFDQNCEGYLKRAADANTIELAQKQLGVALRYMDKQKLTEGYTSVIYRTPDEDIGFWYANIKASSKELAQTQPTATPLEKTNILMKLRETLLDEGKGTSVTAPQGISIYPHNAVYGFGSIILLIIGIIALILDCTSDRRFRW